MKNNLILFYIVQIFHIINEILLSFYILIFPHKYDIYYMIYLLIISIHWMFFKNECILSYIEKKSLDFKYKLGDNPYYHPFQDNIPKIIINILNIFKFISMMYVIIYNYMKQNYIVFYIGIIVLILNLKNIAHKIMKTSI